MEARVALKTALDRPHFYFVIDDVVVFIPPEFVYQNRGTLAQAILQVPLREHTYLLNSLIFGPHKLSDVRYIVADALEAGAGLLYNAQFQQFAEEVRVVTFDDVCTGGRRIYYRNQVRDDEVVRTVDWIS